MARYNAIQIGNVYLTSTGLAGGTPCKTSVTGLEPLKPALKKNIIKAIDGTPYSQVFANDKGFDIEIKIDWLASSVFDAINALFATADSTDGVVAIVIAGDFGTFNFNAISNSEFLKFDKFSSGILQNITYRVVTA